MKARSCFMIIAAACVSLTISAHNKIWYQQPANEWMEALPIGNGRLSAMIYGGVENERIALNEISLWSGQPDSISNNLCGRAHLEEMRQCFFECDPEKGNLLGEKYLTGNGRSFGTHLPLGDLVINFTYPGSRVEGYHRELDIDSAMVSINFSCAEINYKREYIASYPDNVIVAHYFADTPKSMSMSISLDLLRQATVASSTDGLTLEGKVDFPMHGIGGVSFYGKIKIITTGGQVTSEDSVVHIDNADEVTLLIDVRTNYNDSAYRITCENNLERVGTKIYTSLKDAHIADYSALFGRVSITLGNGGSNNLPTDEILQRVKSGNPDPEFDALFFQYGRYMLISSSRPNGTPLCANLQGIWNDNRACNMPWTCDYHLDINIEQNYWSANRANLAECNEPLFSYIAFLAENGERTARQMYGCRGWVAHTVCNAWGYTAPGWGVGWGMNVTGGAWLATHLWSHFRYTCDTTFLRNVGYPLIKKTAMFFLDYMVEDPQSGYLLTGPSVSPEISYVSAGGNHLSLSMMPTIDRCIVFDIYNACIQASEILDVDSELRMQLKSDIARIPPLKIAADGRLQEWFDDVRRSDPTHRHSSHLVSLFPLGQISDTKTPDLIAAAKKDLQTQTSSPTWEDSEWSSANMLCFYARMKDASTAYRWLQNLFKRFTRENLMTVSPSGIAGAEYDIFSFDATEASVAGMCEMLLQSYDGFIEFLPALPGDWSNGTVKGLCAEGGLTVDMEWQDKRVKWVRIRAAVDSSFRINGFEHDVSLKKGEVKEFVFF